MSLNYALVNNPLTADPDDLVARVQKVETVEFPEILKMITRRGLTVTDTEAEAVINELTYTVNELLAMGKSVNTPLVNYRLSIKGSFTAADDLFNSEKHSVKINCTKGKDIRLDYDVLKVEKVRLEKALSIIDLFVDFATMLENDRITPGATAEIRGDALKLDPADTDQGLFLIASDSSETRVGVYLHVKPSGIIFNVPVVPAGVYELEIRRKTKSATILHRAKFSEKLTVL
jgi:hypothetical protein